MWPYYAAFDPFLTDVIDADQNATSRDGNRLESKADVLNVPDEVTISGTKTL